MIQSFGLKPIIFFLYFHELKRGGLAKDAPQYFDALGDWKNHANPTLWTLWCPHLQFILEFGLIIHTLKTSNQRLVLNELRNGNGDQS